MESEHSVAFHLRMDTTEYDRIIRTYIPHYDESRGVQLDLLAAALPHSATRIVDLGGGTGSLAEAILERFPYVSVLVRDLDNEMLAVARNRLARFGRRAELDAGSFNGPTAADGRGGRGIRFAPRAELAGEGVRVPCDSFMRSGLVVYF